MLKSNNNKISSTIKSIAMILALVTVLVMCLAGCTDKEARALAEEVKLTADAAVTPEELSTAVSAALADYAKTADVIKSEDVTAAITEALQGYVKSDAVITEAALNTAITNALTAYLKTADALTAAQVQQMITTAQNAAQSVLGSQITEQAAITNGKADAAQQTADAAINKEIWKQVTELVIPACLEIDAIEKQVTNTKEIYKQSVFDQAMAICYTAKIRLYRAIDADELEKIKQDALDEIAKLPTIQTEADDISMLLDAITIPVTTYQEEAVRAIDAKYSEWKRDYNADDDKARTKGIDVDKLAYAVAKVDLLKGLYDALNSKITNYIESRGVTTDGKTIEEVIAAATADEVLSQIVISDGADLVDIYNDYAAFVGDEDIISHYIDDDDDNNGSDGGVIYYWTVVEKYLEAYNKARFELDKTNAISVISGDLAALVTKIEGYADEAINEELRNAIRELSFAHNANIRNNLLFTGSVYGEYQGNYEEAYQQAKAHLNAVVAKVQIDIAALEGVYYGSITPGSMTNEAVTAANTAVWTNVNAAKVDETMALYLAEAYATIITPTNP